MNVTFKSLGIGLLILLTALHVAVAATFVTSRATLRPGESISSRSPKNGNSTRFIFADIVKEPDSKADVAFLQWAPLLPRAGDYKNGSLVAKGRTMRLWINGLWYSVSFDGKALYIQ